MNEIDKFKLLPNLSLFFLGVLFGFCSGFITGYSSVRIQDAQVSAVPVADSVMDLAWFKTDESGLEKIMDDDRRIPTIIWLRPGFSFKWKFDEALLNSDLVIAALSKSEIPLVMCDYSNPRDKNVSRVLEICEAHPFGSTLVLISAEGAIHCLIDSEKNQIFLIEAIESLQRDSL